MALAERGPEHTVRPLLLSNPALFYQSHSLVLRLSERARTQHKPPTVSELTVVEALALSVSRWQKQGAPSASKVAAKRVDTKRRR